MSTTPRHVLKLGGSLLDWPELVPRFRQWLAGQMPAERLLIVGGGVLANAIRRADELHNLGEQTSHWLAVRTMAIHAEMLQAMLPESRWCDRVRPWIDQPATPGLVIINPWTFAHDEEPIMSQAPLPASWDVTSDSIAARLASLIGATELTLLKSALPASRLNLDKAAESEYFDRFFPQAASRLPLIRAVNLRDEASGDISWSRREEDGG